MKSLKNRIQLKITIPNKNYIEEASNNLDLNNERNNRNTISKITDNIYISGYLIGTNISYLKNNDFTHVINCSVGSSMEYSQGEFSSNQAFYKEGIKYLPILLRDDPEADIIYYFFQIINFIESDKEIINKKILFHCIEGISRAPTMVSGYLMWKENLSLLDVINLIKSKRQCADINLGFNIQLQKWEHYLFSSPKKMSIFELNPSIRLLGEEEKELNSEENYLVKIQYKLFYINHIFKINNNNNNYKKDEKNNNNSDIFQICKDKNKEFIKNIIKYDKTLLKNDFSSLVEIKFY